MKYINLELETKVNGQSNIMKCIIADGVSLTRYSDPQQGLQSYNQSIKTDKTVTFDKGVLKKLYPNKTKEEIKKEILGQVRAVVALLKKQGIQIYTKLKETEYD